jgi:hypothetical protein
MLYEIFMKLFRKNLFVVFNEKYKNENISSYLERYVAKHPLLKPELIVINDQIHGFRKIKQANLSLEKYPIYLEIEYEMFEEETYITSLDLYSEITIKNDLSLQKIQSLAKDNQLDVNVEIIYNFNDPAQKSCVVFSKIADKIFDETLEAFLENTSEHGPVEDMLKKSLDVFLCVIKNIDESLS